MYEGLKEYLESKGYTQPRMAEILGVSVPYVNAVLLGKKSLGKKNAKKGANLFGLSENYLLTGMGSPSPSDEVSVVANRPEPVIDQGSLINSLIAAKDETIASLKSEKEKMQALIDEQADHIKTLKGRLIEYRKLIDAAKIDLSNHPFPMGVAETNL